MKYFRWLTVCGIAGFGAAGILLYAISSMKPGGLVSDREIVVHVVRARQRTEPLRLRFSGKILPNNGIDIVSRLAGKVVEIRFKVGDAVRKGETAAVIQSSALAQRVMESEAALSAARSELTTGAEKLAQAEKELARRRELHEKDLIARRDLEQAAGDAETTRAQVELARARVAQQEAMLAQARTLERFLRIVVPVSGIIVRRWVEPGATIAESSALLTVGEGEAMRATATVPAKYSDDIHAGMIAEIGDPSTPDKLLPAKVASVDGQADAGQRGIEIEFPAVAGKQFEPGSTVEIGIVTAVQESGIWIPQSAVVTEKGKNYVYKIVAGRARRQEVVVGVSRAGEVKIAVGIKDGEWLAADNLNSLTSGTRVRGTVAEHSGGAR